MPQDPYILILDDSTTIVVDGNQLPEGFKKLPANSQNKVARQVVLDQVKLLQQAEKPATAKDFIIPLAILFTLTLIIVWIAKKIKNNPKAYDSVVKLDGKPNREYGSGWKDEEVKG